MPPKAIKRKRQSTTAQASSSSSNPSTSTCTEILTFTDDSYASGCLDSLKDMLDNKELCDVTLNVQGRAFKCHRTVLAMGSFFFHKLFTSGMRDARQDTVELPEVRHAKPAQHHASSRQITHQVTSDGFEKALDFLYSGCVSCRADELPDLLHTADRLSIAKLAGVCVEHLVKGLDADNCIEMWQLYEGGPHTAISEAALGMALRHFRGLVAVSCACLLLFACTSC